MNEQILLFNNWQRFSGDDIIFIKPTNNEQLKVTINTIEYI